MTDPRLASLERDSPLAATLAEFASVAVRVDAGLLRRLRRTLLPEARPAIEADLWFSDIVEARSSSGFQIAPGLLGELRRRLTEKGRPLVAEVRRITAEAHVLVSPLMSLEERVNGLALEKGSAAKADIEEALRPALSQIAGGGPDSMRVARWAQNASARFHPLVLDTAPARGLVLGASLLLRLRPKVSGGPLNAATTISEIAWALPAMDAEPKVIVDVSLVAGGLQFAAPATAGAAIEMPSTEPQFVEIEWTGPEGSQHRLVDAKAGVFVALAGGPTEATLTTLTGDQYRIATVDGVAQQARATWTPPGADLLNACEQLYDAEARHPIGVAFAIAPELLVTARGIVRGMTRVLPAFTEPPLSPLTVMPWGSLEVAEEYDEELVPLRQDNAPKERLEVARTKVTPGHAAAVGYVDRSARWFDCVVEEQPLSPRRFVMQGALIDPPPLPANDLAAAFVGAPVVRDREVVGAILSVSPPATGQTHAVVQLTTTAYTQSVVTRAQEVYRRATTASRDQGEQPAAGTDRLKVLVSGTLTDLVEERQIVIRALTAAGHEAVTWEGDVIAQSRTATEALNNSMDQADAFIFLIGNQYGVTIPDDPDGRSGIEYEYDRAMELGKPCLVFMRGDDFSSKIENLDSSSGIARFRFKIRRQRVVHTFRTRQELEQQVVQGLAELRRQSPRQQTPQPNAPNADAATAIGLFGVPVDPVPLVGRADLLRDLTQLLKTREVSRAKVEGYRPSVISLVGPEGIGKWTLANHAVLAAADAFPDGVIWLGEDGSGYPRHNLRAYAESRGVPELFQKSPSGNDILDQKRFSEYFASRRALFVADQRFTSDIVPTVMLAGPDCMVLRLISHVSTDGLGHVVDVPALSPLDGAALFTRAGGHSLKQSDILPFAEGRPLFLTLLGSAVRWTSEDAVSDALRDASRGSRARSLAEYQIVTVVRLLGAVPERAQAMLSVLSALQKERPLTTRSLDPAALKLLVELGLVEIHGDFVRVHRQVESAFWTLREAAAV